MKLGTVLLLGAAGAGLLWLTAGETKVKIEPSPPPPPPPDPEPDPLPPNPYPLIPPGALARVGDVVYVGMSAVIGDLAPLWALPRLDGVTATELLLEVQKADPVRLVGRVTGVGYYMPDGKTVNVPLARDDGHLVTVARSGVTRVYRNGQDVTPVGRT